VADTLKRNVRRFSASRGAVLRSGVVFVAMAASAGPVYAQTSATTGTTAGGEALKRARDAWNDGDFDVAPRLYQNALDAGGLARADVVDAYVRIGAALAIYGKKRAAVVAFRQAALLDPTFTLPPEAGKRAIPLAEKARKDQRRIGSLGVSAQMQDEVSSGARFGVDVTVAPDRAPVVDSVSLEVRDRLANRAFEQSQPASGRLHFDVPARMTLPDASLVVRVQARDAHGNELLTTEKHVHVGHAVVATAPVPIPILRAPHAPARKENKEERAERSSGGGFWSTAWPYVIGGAALAAGGAAVYFTTRPSADVNVDSARVVVH
jgi:hypothetical protein